MLPSEAQVCQRSVVCGDDSGKGFGLMGVHSQDKDLAAGKRA